MMNDDTMNKGVEIPIEDGTEEMENMAEEVMEDEAKQSVGEEGVTEESAEASDDATADEGQAEEGAGASAEEGAEAGEDAELGEENASEAGAESTAATDDMQTKYMRLMADFQNYKRRTEKEKQDIYSYANEKMILPVLEVLDNFERALNQGTTDEKFQDGMEMILNQLNAALGKAGLKEIEALGQDFDPNFHSAVIMEDTEEYESGKVSNVIQKGYTLNGKVIRPSMVKVAN